MAISEVIERYRLINYLASFFDDNPAQFMNGRQEAESLVDWIQERFIIVAQSDVIHSSYCAKHETKSAMRRVAGGVYMICPECIHSSIKKKNEALEKVLSYQGEHMEEWLFNEIKEALGRK